MEGPKIQWFSIVFLLLVVYSSCKEKNRDRPSNKHTQPTEEKIHDSPDSIQEPDIVNLIQVIVPEPNQGITSPLEIKGKARGTWYFEGDFPVYLLNDKEEKIAQAIATAQGKWMTEDWVPFTASMEFETPASEKGYLVFQKSNPSDLRELDNSFKIPVRFK